MIYSLKPFARVVCGAFNVLMAAAGVYALYRLSAEQPSGAVGVASGSNARGPGDPVFGGRILCAAEADRGLYRRQV